MRDFTKPESPVDEEKHPRCEMVFSQPLKLPILARRSTFRSLTEGCRARAKQTSAARLDSR